MRAADFYAEWQANPAAAHQKYTGKSVTLLYARALLPELRGGWEVETAIPVYKFHNLENPGPDTPVSVSGGPRTGLHARPLAAETGFFFSGLAPRSWGWHANWTTLPWPEEPAVQMGMPIRAWMDQQPVHLTCAPPETDLNLLAERQAARALDPPVPVRAWEASLRYWDMALQAEPHWQPEALRHWAYSPFSPQWDRPGPLHADAPAGLTGDVRTALALLPELMTVSGQLKDAGRLSVQLDAPAAAAFVPVLRHHLQGPLWSIRARVLGLSTGMRHLAENRQPLAPAVRVELDHCLTVPMEQEYWPMELGDWTMELEGWPRPVMPDVWQVRMAAAAQLRLQAPQWTPHQQNLLMALAQKDRLPAEAETPAAALRIMQEEAAAWDAECAAYYQPRMQNAWYAEFPWPYANNLRDIIGWDETDKFCTEVNWLVSNLPGMGTLPDPAPPFPIYTADPLLAVRAVPWRSAPAMSIHPTRVHPWQRRLTLPVIGQIENDGIAWYMLAGAVDEPPGWVPQSEVTVLFPDNAAPLPDGYWLPPYWHNHDLLLPGFGSPAADRSALLFTVPGETTKERVHGPGTYSPWAVAPFNPCTAGEECLDHDHLNAVAADRHAPRFWGDDWVVPDFNAPHVPPLNIPPISICPLRIGNGAGLIRGRMRLGKSVSAQTGTATTRSSDGPGSTGGNSL